jgi:hypothetical protein
MPLKITNHLLGLAALGALSLPAVAAPLQFDQNVTAIIFGTGNPQGGFTTDRDNNLELGLRAKVAFQPTFNSNGNGTYSHATGNRGTVANPLSLWNFEWSINSDLSGTSGRKLDALTYVLSMDFDAGLGTNFRSFDPVMGIACGDHSFGTNTSNETNDSRTVCAAGVGTPAQQAAYAGFRAANNLVQNSWNLGFFDDTTYTFDPHANGQYTFRLQAFDGQRELASTTIDVIVGTGAQPVPVPATLALVGLGLAGLAITRRRRA